MGRGELLSGPVSGERQKVAVGFGAGSERNDASFLPLRDLESGHHHNHPSAQCSMDHNHPPLSLPTYTL